MSATLTVSLRSWLRLAKWHKNGVGLVLDTVFSSILLHDFLIYRAQFQFTVFLSQLYVVGVHTMPAPRRDASNIGYIVAVILNCAGLLCSSRVRQCLLPSRLAPNW